MEIISEKKLVFVSDDVPGITRRRCGKGFTYLDKDGKKVSDEKIMERISGLVIPPNWQNVWICTNAKGYLQVTGYDSKERKQYIYHTAWTQYRQTSKFEKLIEFGQDLPCIRRTLEEDLKLKGWPKNKVLALIVKLLDQCLIRIGNQYYAKENNTYGLTTLRKKHVEQKAGHIMLHFRAKWGVDREVDIEDKTLVKLIKKISELPGYEIFKYTDDDGNRNVIDSQDVNMYLNDIAGKPYTAKNFRTWGGTVLALELLPEALEELKEHPKRNLETIIVEKVAAELGNTVAVCREYYIHPAVLDAVVNQDIDKYKGKAYKLPKIKYASVLDKNEKLALKIMMNVE